MSTDSDAWLAKAQEAAKELKYDPVIETEALRILAEQNKYGSTTKIKAVGKAVLGILGAMEDHAGDD